MKKILITSLVASVLTVSAMAQGVISFSATTGNLIRYTLDNGNTISSFPAGTIASLAPYGALNYTILSSTAGATATSATELALWKPANIAQKIAPGAGSVPSSNFTLDASSGAAGASAAIEVVAWTGTYTTFAAALQGTGLVGWTGSALSGGGMGWTQPTGTTTSPVFITKDVTHYSGLVLATVPEPSTIALAGLGAAAMMIFRRRK